MTTATASTLTPPAEAPSKGVGCGELVLPPLTGELAWILGRPCFAVARIARRLHDLGLYVVDTKAEAEQAAALHFMLGLYAKHGTGWREVAEQTLKGSQQNIRSQPDAPTP